MKPSRTRLAEASSEFERELLRSWEHEQPSQAARDRALTLAGVATAVVVSATAATASAATGAALGAGAATGSLAPKAVTLGALAWSKWVVAGAVVASVGVGMGVGYLRHSFSEARSRVPDATAQSASRASIRPPRSMPKPPAEKLKVAEPLPTKSAPTGPTTAPNPSSPSGLRPIHPTPPVVPVKPASAPPTERLPRSASPPSLGLGEQVAVIDGARAALDGGNAAEALRRVDTYERLFPNGMLSQEATTLRIEALLKQGEGASAADVARRFLASHPTSPHAARIRTLMSSF